MATKLFITGATGYIGGDFLVEMTNAHPDWEVTSLVRTQEKGAQITSQFPKVKLVYGDLDKTDLIEEEASKADIIYHFADCDHEPSARAIAAGMARRTSPTPAFWIHTSGTGILTWKLNRENRFGEDEPHVYNDLEGISELTSLPDDAWHRPVDKIVLAASASHPTKIQTAIVCPPTIYGPGRGPGNARSIQMNMAAKSFLQARQAFSVNEGKNVWHSVHVHDLSKLYLLLGEAASQGGAPATWGDEGYYLAENGSHVWREVFQEIADYAYQRGLLDSAEVKPRSVEDLRENIPWFTEALGTASRGVAKRAAALLGWKPTGPGLRETIPELVESEAKALGL